MSIKKLVNIGGLKSVGDPAKDFVLLTNNIQKEFDYLRDKINSALSGLSSSGSVTNTTVVVNNGDDDSSTTTSLQKAGIVAITSVADQFITFSGDPLASYVLNAYFLDSTGQFANLPIKQSDWSSTGFTLREGIIPAVGMLFYIAIPTN